MRIQLRDLIGEPIAVLYCDPKISRVWLWLAQIHLKIPSKDGLAILSGWRIFVITLDNDALITVKVAESYDSLASSNLLTIKINSDNIYDLVAHEFELI